MERSGIGREFGEDQERANRREVIMCREREGEGEGERCVMNGRITSS